MINPDPNVRGNQSVARYNNYLQSQGFFGPNASAPVSTQVQPGAMTLGGMGPGGVNSMDKYNKNKNFILQQWQAGKATPAHMQWLQNNGYLDQAGGGGVPPGATGAPVAPGPQNYQTGVYGAEQALTQGQAGAADTIRSAVDTARGDINQYSDLAVSNLNPYSTGGQGSTELQAALSGALGPEAQAEAFRNYQESPEQDYLREQTENAILRNASSLGGLGGGSVLKELQRNAAGLASTDYANAFERLGGLSDRGLAASGLQSKIQQGRGNALSDLAFTGGMQIGDMQYGTGVNKAGIRSDAGNAIANAVAGTSTGLADLLSGGGRELAAGITEGGSNLSNLLLGAGLTQQQADQFMSTLLANIASGSATNVSGLPSIPGLQKTDGALEDIQNLMSMVPGGED